MGVHLLVLPFKMGIYRKRNVHCIGSSLETSRVCEATIGRLYPRKRNQPGMGSKRDE